MRKRLRAGVLAGALAIVAGALPACAQPPSAGPAAPAAKPALRAPDVHYEPTPDRLVDVMLKLADVKSGDVVHDLGCGDGRIVIAAVRRAGVRGVCVDIDPQRIAEARENARRAGVVDRIRFVNDDLFAIDLAEATAVMLFLSPELNRRLRPKLLSELRPGSRVVSHWHDMGDWAPQRAVQETHGGRTRGIYLWVIPRR